MPRRRNPEHRCKLSSIPETKEERRHRLDLRRIRQRQRLTTTPPVRKVKRTQAQESARRLRQMERRP